MRSVLEVYIVVNSEGCVEAVFTTLALAKSYVEAEGPYAILFIEHHKIPA